MKLIPKNWAAFQHYKDRSPPWIKLHKGLLDDRQYQRLPLASRALAPMLWLIASESKDGVFDAHGEELAFRLRHPEAEIAAGLAPLIEAGFFVPADAADGTPQSECNPVASTHQATGEQLASTVLTGRDQVAAPEAEGETEGEKEADGNNSARAEPSSSTDSCPHQQIIALFHELIPTARRVREWTPARQQALRTRWREKHERQNLDWWRKLFGYVATSDFLCGRTKPAAGRKPFDLSLDWLCKSENLVKVMEGAYEN